LELADNGVDATLANNPAIEHGLDTHKGKLVHLSRAHHLALED
jgi:alanine dehydrogenase